MLQQLPAALEPMSAAHLAEPFKDTWSDRRSADSPQPKLECRVQVSVQGTASR